MWETISCWPEVSEKTRGKGAPDEDQNTGGGDIAEKIAMASFLGVPK